MTPTMLWPEGCYEGTPIRVDMRGGGSVWFEIHGRTVRIPLKRRGFNLSGRVHLSVRHVGGKERWSVAR